MKSPTPLRFAILGTGFWARYQLAAWRELEGVSCVALYNRTRHKAQALADEFSVPAVYDSATELLHRETLDFVDIITDVGTHGPLCALAAHKGLTAICQKPMAPSLEDAVAMVDLARQCRTRLYVHENFRWQEPFRRLRALLDDGAIGRPLRAQLDMVSGFDVFANQPFLRDLEQFILTDVGSHTLDVARFLFGEARTLYCRTARTRPDIRGENLSTHLLEMGGDGMPVIVRMGYACNPLERECFPQCLVQIEGSSGSLELDQHLNLRLTTSRGTLVQPVPLPYFPWADPRYAVVHTSIVPCHRNILAAIQGGPEAETTAEDNLKTMELVFASYQSAASGQVVALDHHPMPAS